MSSALLFSFVNDFNIMQRVYTIMRYHKMVRSGEEKHWYSGKTKEDFLKEIKQLTTETNQNDLHYDYDPELWRLYNKS